MTAIEALIDRTLDIALPKHELYVLEEVLKVLKKAPSIDDAVTLIERLVEKLKEEPEVSVH